MKTKLLTTAALSVVAISAAAQEKPNIILIMTDDQGWGDVGFNGNKDIFTPHLDDLASQGIIFDRFYTGCAVSSPTRASVLTGRNPFRTGIFNANNGILRPEEQTLPELLKKKGYVAGHFGKWHLGTLTYKEVDANRGRPENKNLYNIPAQHGYDDSFVTESKVPSYDPMYKPSGSEAKPNFWDYIRPGQGKELYGTYYWKHDGTKETENLGGEDSRVVMDRVLPFIDDAVDANKPFFSVVWFHQPHLPCIAGPDYQAMYADLSLEERNYYGCITSMDDQVGRLVRYLKNKGVYENTIICFCSDNGPERNTPGVTGGLKDRKRSLHEGGLRVPGFMVWPGHIKAGQRTNHAFSTYDYLPTFVELLDLETPAYHLDGESMLPGIMKGAERVKPLVVVYTNQCTVIEQRFKLYVRNGNEVELYEIDKDRAEEHNVADKYPKEVKRMTKIMNEYVDDFKASFEGEEYGTASYEKVKQGWREPRKFMKLKIN